MQGLSLAARAAPEHATQSVERQLAAAESAATTEPRASLRDLREVHGCLQRLAMTVRGRLFAAQRTRDDLMQALWLSLACRRVAAAAGTIAESLSGDILAAEACCEALGLAAFHCGESTRVESGTGHYPIAPDDVLAAMAPLLAARRHCPVKVPSFPGPIECALGALERRARLLAMLAARSCDGRHLEIVDAWLRRWLPVLQGGARVLQAEYANLVELMHRGHTVLDASLPRDTAMEEQIGALDLLLRLLERRGEPLARAPRREASGPMELLHGLGNVAAALTPGESLEVAAQGWLVDESDTGVCVEAPARACRKIAVGDLVALRDPRACLALGRVARCDPAISAEHMRIGLSRLSWRANPLPILLATGGHAGTEPILLLSNADTSGRHDLALLSDRVFFLGARILVKAGEREFPLQVRRARARGRGWVLAGFQVAEPTA